MSVKRRTVLTTGTLAGVGARIIVPVHHQSFALSREPLHEPIERAERMLREEQGRLGLREIGETVIVKT